ncbi:hypothetical protein PMAYCL1PPCAC_03741, partial [Pristionchus mayeri]
LRDQNHRFKTGACSLRKTSGALSQSSRRFGSFFWTQAVNGQVVFRCQYRQTSRFLLAVSNLLYKLSRLLSGDREIYEKYEWLGRLAYRAEGWLFLRGCNLQYPKTPEFSGFGTLDTRTWHWHEIQAIQSYTRDKHLIPLRNGNYVIVEMTKQTGQIRT